MFTVRISRVLPPKFPDQCAVCGRGGPETTYALGSGNLATDLLSRWQPGQVQMICHVPVCNSCKRRWTWYHRAHWLAGIAIAIAVVTTLPLMVPFLPPNWQPQLLRWRKYIVLGVMVVFTVLADSVVKRVLPLPMTLVADPQDTTFSFQSSAYGMRFDDLNQPIDIEERFARLEDQQEEA